MTDSLIITCINLGSSHSANYATYEILKAGLATSASLMVPCPWAREAAMQKDFRGMDVGVQLTLNAEFENYRWGPITQSPSLFDGTGGFPKTLSDFWEHADPDEVWKECRSQIERASLWGLEISHLGSYLEALLPRPEYFDIYLELAKEFGLALRLPENSNLNNVESQSEHLQKEYGFPIYELAKNAGIPLTHNVITLTGNSKIPDILSSLKSSQPESQITEIVCAPLLDTPEARAITTDEDGYAIKQKLEELNKWLSEPIQNQEIQLTNWSELASKNLPKV